MCQDLHVAEDSLCLWVRTIRQTVEFVLDSLEIFEQLAAGDELRYFAGQDEEEFFDVSVHAKAPVHEQ